MSCRCLLCKCYSAAASVLSVDACEVDPSKTALTSTDFLLYCYYGARVHIGATHLTLNMNCLLKARLCMQSDKSASTERSKWSFGYVMCSPVFTTFVNIRAIRCPLTKTQGLNSFVGVYPVREKQSYLGSKGALPSLLQAQKSVAL